MAGMFNAIEILKIAQRIEENGARFYLLAAEKTADANQKKTLLDLSAMEEVHEKTFVEMEKRFTSSKKELEISDLDGEVDAYLRAFAEGRVFDLNAAPEKLLKQGASWSDILKTAIGLEKDSIVFYLGIRRMVPESLGKSQIDDIIAEEMRHISMLSLARMMKV
jgi:rubrerythrin